MSILVTGGSGFIGSALCRHLIKNEGLAVVNVDKMTYAAVPGALDEIEKESLYSFENIDICNQEALITVFKRHQPTGVIHLAAESHVDRSIDGPTEFIQTNILGTFFLLNTALKYWEGLENKKKKNFKFHNVSTDEVFGSLGKEGFFTEQTRYKPNSPYSASKASSDHFVRAWNKTYGLPVITSNCSNNYGPYQFPEKLIPLMIINVLLGQPLPIYGDGKNIRDWLYVEDHAKGLTTIFMQGKNGESYNVGGNNEATNLEVVEKICEIIEEIRPNIPILPARSLITFVEDRPGHDQRYAIDSSKTQKELGWHPLHDLGSGLRQTIKWYIKNQEWWKTIRSNNYKGERLGLRANL